MNDGFTALLRCDKNHFTGFVNNGNSRYLDILVDKSAIYSPRYQIDLAYSFFIP